MSRADLRRIANYLQHVTKVIDSIQDCFARTDPAA